MIPYLAEGVALGMSLVAVGVTAKMLVSTRSYRVEHIFGRTPPQVILGELEYISGTTVLDNNGQIKERHITFKERVDFRRGRPGYEYTAVDLAEDGLLPDSDRDVLVDYIRMRVPANTVVDSVLGRRNGFCLPTRFFSKEDSVKLTEAFVGNLYKLESFMFMRSAE